MIIMIDMIESPESKNKKEKNGMKIRSTCVIKTSGT